MKNFEEIYKKIYNEKNNKLEKTRKKYLHKKLIFISIAIILAILSTFISPFITIFIAFIILIVIVIPTKFNEHYKDEIITTLVTEYDSSLSFTRQQSIPSSLYKQAEFEHYDIYHSNDYISGKIDGIIPFELGDICTEDESTDSDGNRTTYTIFRGLFSAATFNQSINTTVKIRAGSTIAGKLLSNKEKMQMDSQEFEKLFNVYTLDKITAMRILTSDILDYMITFKKENKIKFELTLKQNKLYIRIHCQDMFESSILKNALDKRTLEKYYKYLDFMCQLNKKFYNVIESKEL